MRGRTSTQFLLARHIETEKNLRRVHGISHLSRVTSLGLRQAASLAKLCGQLGWLAAVTHTPTEQARVTAALLSRLTGLPLSPPVDLRAVDLGMAAGKSQDDLMAGDPEFAEALEAFRLGGITANELELPGSESWTNVEQRLRRWWVQPGPSSLANHLVVASSSTLVMLANAIAGTLPASGRYRNYHALNASVRAFRLMDEGAVEALRPLTMSSWPAVESTEASTRLGRVRSSTFFPGWEVRDATAVILPGYFSNSRAGPYGLYTRLARDLSAHGIRSITVDYLGFGESDPIRRTFSSDLASLEAVLLEANSAELFLIGHSLGSALVCAGLGMRPEAIGIALAPMYSLHQLSRALLTGVELNQLVATGSTTRRGVTLDAHYVEQAESAWSSGSDRLSTIVLGSEDHYSPAEFLSLPHAVETVTIEGADHNFASHGSSDLMIAAVRESALAETEDPQIRIGISG